MTEVKSISEAYCVDNTICCEKLSLKSLSSGKIFQDLSVDGLQIFTVTHNINECKSILQVGCESQVYEEPRQTSKTELFVKIVTGFQLLTIFDKNSV